MKVITEERLQDRYDSIVDEGSLYSQGAMDILDSLMQECQEIDTLTVSKLRPMQDLKIGEFAICYSDDPFLDSEKYKKIDDHNVVNINGSEFDINDFIGWIPVPTHKPEEK